MGVREPKVDGANDSGRVLGLFYLAFTVTAMTTVVAAGLPSVHATSATNAAIPDRFPVARSATVRMVAVETSVVDLTHARDSIGGERVGQRESGRRQTEN